MVLAIAHRGDPVHRRENTLDAFAAAVAQGADWIEIDLRRTSDSEIVVLHDPTLERLWGVARDVQAMMAHEVCRLGVPTLAETLDAVSVPLMVDFTGPQVVDGAVTAVRAAGAMPRCLFVTGHLGALRRLRARVPEARLGITWQDPSLPATALLTALRPEYWNPAYPLVSSERVAHMHALGLSVSTWTVDERHDMDRMMAAGVDAIVSNQIGRLRHALDEQGAGACTSNAPHGPR